MPELPEVETIKRDIKKVLLGKKILGAEILDKKPVIGQEKEFMNLKAVIKDACRFGKILVLDLDKNRSLMIHLKMTGQLIFLGQKRQRAVVLNSFQDLIKSKKYNVKSDKSNKLMVAGGHYEVGSLQVPNKFTRLIFNLNQGKLYFNDLRKFGWIRLVQTDKIKDLKEIKNLGIEPLHVNFTVKVFKEILEKRPNKPIKQLLMEQNLISGIGNIYASEALFWAKIDPRRKAGDLKENEIKNLHKSIIKVLKEGIKLKGSSENTYVDLFGEKGVYLKREVVYRREGQNCPRHCGGKVERIKQGGRSTFFCPKCQK